MIRIGIVDDHEIFAQGIKQLLKDEGLKVVFTCDNGLELEQRLKSKPDVVDILLLDINLGKESGIDHLSWLQKNYPKIKIIMLTMFQSTFLCNKCLSKGASGYLLKTLSKDEVLKAVNTVYEEGNYIDKSMEKEMAKANETKGLELLTSRELDVFLLAIRGIASHVIAEKLHLSLFTVDCHRKNIKSKLNTSKIADWINLAHQHGLMNLHN